jgi:serine/threonine protein kinase
MWLEDFFKLQKCRSWVAAKAAASTLLDSYLDDNAFAPPPKDSSLDNIYFELGPVDESDIAIVGSGINPVQVGGGFPEKAEESIQHAKKLGKVDMEPFTRIAKALNAFLHNNFFGDFKKSKYFTKFVKLEHWYSQHTFTEDDFEIFRVLGRGGFGLVNGCRCMRTGKVYAMKTMDKRRVKMNRGEEMCKFEKELLQLCKSDFVLDLKYSFFNDFELFIIMDVKAGGDLNFLIQQQKCFTKEMTQYFLARTCEGLQDIHNAGWIYRDLKPENLLLGDDGTCWISDLGLACPWKEGMAGIAGTPGYWCPEMLRKEPYDRGVDFWTLGVVLVEFLTGTCPFRNKAALEFGKSKGEKDKLLCCNMAVLEMEVEYDTEKMSEDAIDLAKKLLTKDPKERLGKNGIGDIKGHKYFEGFDWDAVTDGSMVPPFVPEQEVNAADQDSIGKFKNESEVKEIKLSDKDHSKYKNFPSSNKKAFEIDATGLLIWEKSKGRPLTATVTRERSQTCSLM